MTRHPQSLPLSGASTLATALNPNVYCSAFVFTAILLVVVNRFIVLACSGFLLGSFSPPQCFHCHQTSYSLLDSSRADHCVVTQVAIDRRRCLSPPSISSILLFRRTKEQKRIHEVTVAQASRAVHPLLAIRKCAHKGLSSESCGEVLSDVANLRADLQ